MAFQIPPWLNVGPTDYLRAIQAGTQSGLEVARTRAAMQEAAARRAQAQQEAAQRAWEFGETMRQSAALAAEENARQREYNQGILNWHQQQLRMDAEKAALGDAAAQARMAETARHNLAQEELNKTKAEKSVMPTLWSRDPNAEYISATGTRIPPLAQTISPVDKALLASATKQLQTIDKEIFDLTGGTVPEVGTLGWGSGKKKQYDSLVEQRDRIMNSIRSLGGQAPTSISPNPSLNVNQIGQPEFGIPAIPNLVPLNIGRPSEGTTGLGASLLDPRVAVYEAQIAQEEGATPTVKTQAEFDALDHGTIYIGKDGKRYRKP